jgi:MerR family copper efflux transcriptional regulator
MLIGELAQKTGTSKETIRYYERIGLVEPDQRRDSGYREYTQEEVKKLHFINRAKQLGFTLNEISELLELEVNNETSCEPVRRKATDKLENVQQKIKALRHIEEVLQSLITACNHDEVTEKCVILRALEGEAMSEEFDHE